MSSCQRLFFFLKFLYRISVTLYILRDYFVSSIGTAPNFSNECFVLLQIDYSLAYIRFYLFFINGRRGAFANISKDKTK